MQSYPCKHVVAYRKSDRAIGFENHLLYRLEKDMAHFRSLTRHHIVLMGRNTYESIGCKPLADRVNVVLSKTLKQAPPGFELFSRLEDALHWCKRQHIDKYVFVIGGEQLYRQTLPMTNVVYATEITDHKSSLGDAFYPDISEDFPRRFDIVREVHSYDSVGHTDVPYDIVVYNRNRLYDL